MFYKPSFILHIDTHRSVIPPKKCEIVRELQRLMNSRLIAQYNDFLEKYTDDAMAALFCVPKAQGIRLIVLNQSCTMDFFVLI